MSEKPKTIFDDLGKATLRGIRKCPKCGTYNGTRGLCCKNKECGLVFKISKTKSQRIEEEAEAVKVLCSSNLQIYSVKRKETGEHHRCFVHLPIIEGIESLQDDAEVKLIKQSAAMCYATTCKKSEIDPNTITLNFNPCLHTSSVVTCQLDAIPLVIKRMIVNLLSIDENIKQEVCRVSSGTEDHLVQRISKNTMIVKCDVDSSHPLGFLHFYIFEPKKNSKRYKVLCECQTEQTKPFIPTDKKMCLHLYLCVSAIASDQKVLSEFNTFIQQILKIEEDSQTNDAQICNPVLEPQSNDLHFVEVFSKRPRLELLITPDSFSEDNTKASKTAKKIPILKLKTKKEVNKVTLPSIQFEEWLASVTERINQTMHYQFDGAPKPLLFQVPQLFFEVLQSRITSGSKKKRLPNAVVAFSRKDSPPLGVFSKYRYEITNILHVKRIFDTSSVPLEVTRSFVENKDGTFTIYKHSKACGSEKFPKADNAPVIKPCELKTFLKVGITNLGQKEPTPFVIEWVPDVLPKTHVGELTIQFEYGHQKNGLIEKRNQTPAKETENSINT